MKNQNSHEEQVRTDITPRSAEAESLPRQQNIRKPMSIYLIAFWTYFQSTFYAVLPMRILSQMIGGSTTLPREIMGLLAVPVIILLILLIQLRPIARAITIILMSFATLMLSKMFITSFFMSTLNTPPKAQIGMAVMILLNALSLFYLARPRFAATCRAYRAQRERVAKERYFDKQARKVLKQTGNI